MFKLFAIEVKPNTGPRLASGTMSHAVAFVNFSGYLNGKTTTSSFSCSKVEPCYNVDLKNVSLRVAMNETSLGTSKCSFVEEGGVHGVEGSGC